MKASPARAAAPPPPEAQADGPNGLEAFSLELGQRYPNRMIRRFIMPTTVRECREIFLLEITSRDEVNAAIFADATMSDIEKSSVRLSADAERREAIRLSIVGMGTQEGGRRAAPADPVSYQHVNHDGIPFGALNEWSGKAWTSLHAYFGQLNGVPADELSEGIKGARTVGAYAPPTSGTPASADGGR